MSKLIRDKIPAIIRGKGSTPITRIADRDEYREALFDKLTEEAGELREADSEHAPEELADMLEVVLALAADHGVTRDDLEEVRQAKTLTAADSISGSSGTATASQPTGSRGNDRRSQRRQQPIRPAGPGP
jgi:predicted house-cleaning noncanonical NTP pyrophosphatase (MazG superfamily)